MSRHENQPGSRNAYPGNAVRRHDYEVDYLAHLMHVPPSLVEEAIATAGTNRHNVKKYIKKKRVKHNGN